MNINMDIPGWMTETELTVIAKLATKIPEHSLAVELGTFCGRSAWAWMHNMPATAQLDLVDVWYIDYHDGLKQVFDEAHGSQENKDLLLQLVKEHNSDGSGPYKAIEQFLPDWSNVKKHKCDVAEYTPPRSPSIVFIDAEHTHVAVTDDIQKYRQYQECLLVGHDFAQYALPVVRAVVENFHTRTLVVFKNTSIWMAVPSNGYWATVIPELLTELM
jgi:hypothetical protein